MGVPAKKNSSRGEVTRIDSRRDRTPDGDQGLRGDLDQRHPRRVRASTQLYYWHFGSKEGVLAAMMERGAQRFFAAIPTWDEAHGPVEQRSERQLTELVSLQSQHPDFLRLFYLLSMERSQDPAVAAVVRRVRNTAIARFRDSITHLLPSDIPPGKADLVVAELTAFAVALSDGVYFAGHLEPDTTDVERMYRRLRQALEALIPVLLEET